MWRGGVAARVADVDELARGRGRQRGGRCWLWGGEWTPGLRALLILRGGIDARVAGVCMDMYILKDECIININYECKYM